MRSSLLETLLFMMDIRLSAASCSGGGGAEGIVGQSEDAEGKDYIYRGGGL